MKKHLILVLLVALVAVAVVAFAQTRDTSATGTDPAETAAMSPQGVVHGEHLIVLRGSMLNVYSLRDLPDATLVYSAQVPGSLDEAQMIMAARTKAECRPAERAAKTSDPPADGPKVYASLACAACHRIGTSGGTVGPDLSHEGSSHDEAWIEKKVTDPKATNKNSIMPAHQLPKPQLEALGKYLAGLK